MWPAFVWTSTKNEWNSWNSITSLAFGSSFSRNLIRVFRPYITWNLGKAQRWSKSVFIFHRCCPHSLTFGYFKFSQNNILISLTLYFHLNIKDRKCLAVEKREEKKTEKYKIVSESTETVHFVPKRFFRKIMMSFWFGAKESESRYDSLSISIQSSPEHSRL